jgi:methylmalonyl-CoA/ethylmalonyl-CoA epimerase
MKETDNILKKIDHLGIAIKNLAEVKKIYQALFHSHFSPDEILADQKVKLSFTSIEGVRLEFLEPTSDDSPIARFIQKRGEGIHHICFRVINIQEKLDTLKKQGVQLIDEKPRRGAGGNWIAFLHPKSTGGILMELSEPVTGVK